MDDAEVAAHRMRLLYRTALDCAEDILAAYLHGDCNCGTRESAELVMQMAGVDKVTLMSHVLVKWAEDCG